MEGTAMMIESSKIKDQELLEFSHMIIKALARFQILKRAIKKDDYDIPLRKNYNVPVGIFYSIHPPDLSETIQDNLNCISLDSDPVLPFPWSHSKFRRNLSSISPGNWKQTSRHFLVVYDPFFAYPGSNGNHSVSVGIWREEGSICGTNVTRYSILPIFKRVRFDINSMFYVDSQNKKLHSKRISNSAGILFGIAYELARKAYCGNTISDKERDLIVTHSETLIIEIKDDIDKLDSDIRELLGDDKLYKTVKLFETIKNNVR
ncbi:DUF6710 family protein [Thermococcus sp. GR4]|uniref:DUF6710 family protein n=1 Tax=Thermococcus sp. GR4 TaxID=1638254 RepID=UPI001430323A|nr:DUF6710 family protein [Thermococcus sp. GR4]NJE79423.1 hypothetical protein [Thermococcus sp. GR4]